MKGNKVRDGRSLVVGFDYVNDYEGLSPTARRVLRLYATWVDQFGVAHFTQKVTADELDRAPITIHAAIRELVEKGFAEQLAHGRVRVDLEKVRVDTLAKERSTGRQSSRARQAPMGVTDGVVEQKKRPRGRKPPH